ncbi:hypothetical protein FBU30_004980 [Linnemannia zychae]|nr:hypothetical protein FBU30_004980 [Linnemannia zychae]
MCGRTAQGLAPGQIRLQLERTLPSKPADTWIGEEKYRTSYNVAPTRYQPVVRADAQTKSYVVHLMRWGLIPRHSQSMPEYSSVLKSINARDDSLFTGPTCKAMFNHSKNLKRCILLAEGFYEWRRRGKERVPFYTRRRDGNVMLMAAIYDIAMIKEEAEPLYTYATITTNASPQLDWLHDRMPVIIPNNDHDKIRTWLDPNRKWDSVLESMLKPYDEFTEENGEQIYSLETYQVDDKVNSVKNDSPDFIKPWNSSTNKKTLNRFFFSKADPTSPSASIKKEGHQEIRSLLGEFNDDSTTAVEDSLDDYIKDEDEKLVAIMEDESQLDTGFDEQQQQPQDMSFTLDGGPDYVDPEDRDLALALELSRQEHAIYEAAVSPPSFSTLLSNSLSSSSIQKSASSESTLENPFVVPRTATKSRPSLIGSVDLLEKRRQQRKQEEEEMQKVLELSRLDAIADGQEIIDDNGNLDNTAQSIPTLFENDNNQSREDSLGRQEAEELARAIAASLSDATATGSSTPSPSTLAITPPLPHSKNPTLSTTVSPRKRKQDGQPSPSSPVGLSPMKPGKKVKPSQDVKITSFFQNANAS